MRNMTSTAFCVVCQENNWLQFLNRMSLLDGVSISTVGSSVTVTAEAVPLAQLRFGGSMPNENYTITWRRNGAVRTDLNGKFSFTEATSSAQGTWSVTLEYETTEVRSDPNNLLVATENFTV